MEGPFNEWSEKYPNVTFVKVSNRNMVVQMHLQVVTADADAVVIPSALLQLDYNGFMQVSTQGLLLTRQHDHCCVQDIICLLCSRLACSLTLRQSKQWNTAVSCCLAGLRCTYTVKQW